MSELANSIKDKISQTQKDINTANNKAEEFRRKTVEYEQKGKELQSFLLHLKEWLVQIEGDTPLSDYENENVIKGGIRRIILQYLGNHTAFTGAELIATITAENPQLKPASIRSTLSRIKDEGIVTHAGTDSYITRGIPNHAHIATPQLGLSTYMTSTQEEDKPDD